MINFEHSIEINRPVEVVFDYLIHNENEPQWQAGLLESKKTSEGPAGVGMTGRDVRKFMGRESITTWEVTQFEPNRLFAFNVIQGPVPFQGAYTFRVDGNGTRVTITAQAEMSGLSRLFEPLITRMGKQQYEADFVTLKRVLETMP
jgi:uncharacterized membrane protein